MVSPAYPAEMPHFTRGLAAVGARVFGLGDAPRESLPEEVQRSLVGYSRVGDLWDEPAVCAAIGHEAARAGLRLDRVECLWEPAMVLAARLRETLRVPGLTVEQTLPFRDKERMKQVLDAAGIRTPWHRRAQTKDGVRAAAEEVGFPLIVKPIAGAGATDTHRVLSREQLERVLALLGHVDEVSVEEYVEGDELTHDTICADGKILFENMSYYRTRPIEERKHLWVSPSCVALRDIEAPELQAGRRMGRAVLQALGFRTGFTHMEWYRRPDGEVIFGEIGARPPGARMVEVMNYASDIDLFRGWAEAVCHGSFSQPLERKYNAAIVMKRAYGRGRLQQVEGLDRLVAELRPHIAAVHVNPPGSPVGDWQRAAAADGFVIVRHPDLDTTLQLAERVGRELQLFAG
jgi:hypothetical protein